MLQTVRDGINKLVAGWARLAIGVKVGAGVVGLVLIIVGVSWGVGRLRMGGTQLTWQPFSLTAPGGFTKLEVAQKEPKFFELKPEQETSFGVGRKSGFVLSTRQPVSAEFVKAHLETSVPMRVVASTSTEYKLVPEREYEAGQVVQAALKVKDVQTEGQTFDRNYGWSFQAQPKLEIKNTLPGNEKTEVPVNTGIEIVFSLDDYKDPTGLIAISPAVRFRTERHRETLAIVPVEPLKPATIYTVTLKKGLDLQSQSEPITSDYSWSFQTARAEPVDLNRAWLGWMKEHLQVTPNQPVQLEVGVQDEKRRGEKAKVEVYKFGSSEEFINSRKGIDAARRYWYAYYAETNPVKTDGLEKVLATELGVASLGEGYEKVDYLQLPAPLPVGQYLIQLKSNNNQVWGNVWVQSTWVGVYVTVGREQSLVWTNDLQTGNPIEGAQVGFTGTPGQYYSSGDGVALFPTNREVFDGAQHYIKVARDTDNSVVMPVTRFSSEGNVQDLAAEDFWSYLYTERRLFHPTDTINWWGVVKQRQTGQAPATVQINLTSGYDLKTTVKQSNVQTGAGGVFTGAMEFSDLPEGWYNLDARVNGLIISSTGFQIEKFAKPEVKLEVTKDKQVLFAGETVNYVAGVKFFDETPARNVDVGVVNFYRSGNEEVKQTDDRGQVNWAFTPEYVNPNDYPRYEGTSFTVKTASGVGQAEYGSVFVFGSQMLVFGQGNSEGKVAHVRAEANWADLTKFKQGTKEEVKGVAIANRTVKLMTTKSWSEQHQEGTYYDFVEKVVRPRYRYEFKQETLPEVSLTTDANGKISYDFNMENQKSYRVDIVITDDKGRTDTISEYFYNYEGYTYQPQTSDTVTLELAQKDNHFSVGEMVVAKVMKAGKAYQGTDRTRYLYALASRGRMDYWVNTQTQFETPFMDKHVPTAYLAGVLFTGNKYIKMASGACEWDMGCGYWGEAERFDGLQLNFRNTDRQLQVEIQMEKDKYLPGEKAKLTASVKRDGQPVSGVPVNVVLVDEALAAIGGVVEPSALTSLYRSLPAMMYYENFSHKDLMRKGSGAEKGGGGGDRDIFKDTAYFGQTVTNEAGEGTVEVQLPDNLTTWLVYAQAVMDQATGLLAGQTEGRLIVSKDFFVTSSFPREYLTADQVQVVGNSFGRGLATNNRVNYELRVKRGEQEVGSKDGVEKAFAQIGLDLPRLGAGNYLVTLRGNTGNLTDGVTYPVVVKESRISFRAAKKYPVKAGEEIRPEVEQINQAEPVQLIITDKGRGEWYWQLYNYCGSDSNRIEKRLAAVVASQELATNWGETGCVSANATNWQEWQSRDGGIAQVKWGGSDVETSVWALYAGAEGIDTGRLRQYLQSKTKSGGVEQIRAWWGLSKLGESHLTELRQWVSGVTGFEEKATLAWVLADLGEQETARDMYWELLADYGWTNKPYVRMERDQNHAKADLNLQVMDTAKVLLIGSRVEAQYSSEMQAYLRDYTAGAADVTIDLAQVLFAKQELAKRPKEKTVISVTVGGKKETVELDRGCGCMHRTVLPSQLGGVRVKVESGLAEVGVNYAGNADTLKGISKDNRLQIERSYERVAGQGAVKVGDLIRVTLRFNVNQGGEGPLGQYLVRDYLPSGLVRVENPWLYKVQTRGWWWQEGAGQIRGSYYKSLWGDNLREMVYYARAVAPGRYEAEPAIIQYANDLSIINTTTQSQQMEIGL